MQLSDKTIGIGIWSEDFEKLAKWYEEILDFKVKRKLNLPNDTVIEFDFGKNFFFIGKHSKVKGKNKDPYRIMIGFNVKSVRKVYEELTNNGVKFVAKPFEAPEGGYWCTTALDPEGNILQFFGQK